MICSRWVSAAVVAGVVSLVPASLVGSPARTDSDMAASLAGAVAFTPLHVDDTDSLFAQAGRLYAQRRFREAIPLFQRVVEIEPRNGNAFALLGGSYFQLGDYARAIGAFEQALAVDEGIKLAYIGLVAANYLTRRVEDAQQWLVRLVPILSGEERDRYLATLSSQFPELTLPGS